MPTPNEAAADGLENILADPSLTPDEAAAEVRRMRANLGFDDDDQDDNTARDEAAYAAYLADQEDREAEMQDALENDRDELLAAEERKHDNEVPDPFDPWEA